MNCKPSLNLHYQKRGRAVNALLLAALLSTICCLTCLSQDLKLKLAGKVVKLKEVKNTAAISYDTAMIRSLKSAGFEKFDALKSQSSVGKNFCLFEFDAGRKQKAFVDKVDTYNRTNDDNPDVLQTSVYRYRDVLNVLTDEFVINFKAETSWSEIARYFLENEIDTISRSPFAKNQFLIRFRTKPPKEIVHRIENNEFGPPVNFIEPNFIQIIRQNTEVFREQGLNERVYNRDILQSDEPNDSLLSRQWYLRNVGIPGKPDADIKGVASWGISKGDADIIVAIIDDGVDLAHPDLKDKIVGSFNINKPTSSAQPLATQAHGTACAGIAAATTNNSIGISGIAWNSKIISVKVFDLSKDGDEVTTGTVLGLGIKKAVDKGAKVLSCSWSCSIATEVEQAIDYALQHQCILVFGAGNKSTDVDYPANLASGIDIFCVSATNEWDEFKSRTSKDNEKWWGSNYGEEVTIAAPGVHMYTTDLSQVNYGYNKSSKYFSNFNGTSASVPLVAGSVALILGYNKGLSPSDVIRLVKQNSDRPDARNRDNYLGFGRLNLLRALNAVKASYP